MDTLYDETGIQSWLPNSTTKISIPVGVTNQDLELHAALEKQQFHKECNKTEATLS